jgi:murein DD-endopeptidase MepM/ murein hydrolase activator NlpD
MEPGIIAPELLLPSTPHGVDQERSLRGKPPLEVAREFEAILAAQMIAAMRQTVPSGGLLPASASTRMLEGAFDHELARSITKRGDLGIARQLVHDLEMRAHDVAPATATSGRATGAAAPPLVVRPNGTATTPAADAPRVAATVRPVDGRVTSRFGVRRDPITGAAEFHAGVDLAAPRGAEVHAVAPGEVIFSGPRGNAGNVVEVRHPGALVTTYAHVDRTLVRAGQKVAAGDVVATVGSTGRTTGPHLHFAVQRAGHPIDPAQVLGRGRGPLAAPIRLVARRPGV